MADPCVCRCRCSGRYSTSAWHQCLFQFHLIALVIKLRTDTPPSYRWLNHIWALLSTYDHIINRDSYPFSTPPSLFAHPSCPLFYFLPQTRPRVSSLSNTLGLPVSVHWRGTCALPSFRQRSFRLAHAKLFLLRPGWWADGWRGGGGGGAWLWWGAIWVPNLMQKWERIPSLLLYVCALKQWLQTSCLRTIRWVQKRTWKTHVWSTNVHLLPVQFSSWNISH